MENEVCISFKNSEQDQDTQTCCFCYYDLDDDDDDEIAYFTVRWKTRASLVYRTKNELKPTEHSKNRKRSH